MFYIKRFGVYVLGLVMTKEEFEKQVQANREEFKAYVRTARIKMVAAGVGIALCLALLLLANL